MHANARCPECGAGVVVAPSADAVTCRSCAATFQVARTGPEEAPARRAERGGRPVLVLSDGGETPLGVAAGAALVSVGFGVGGVLQLYFALHGEAWSWLGAAAFLGIAGLAAWLGVRFTRAAVRTQRVLATGLPGEARITRLELGFSDGEHAGTLHLSIDLSTDLSTEPTDVHQPGPSPVETKVHEKIPAVLVPMLLEGVVLPVRVDPADPTFAVVEWDVAASRVGPSHRRGG